MKYLFILNDPPYGTNEETIPGAQHSTLEPLAEWTEWAEKVWVF